MIILSLTPVYLRFCLQYLSSCHGDLLLAICTRLHNITETKKASMNKIKRYKNVLGKENKM